MLRTKPITQNATGSSLGQRKPPGMELSLRPVAEDLWDFTELVRKASQLSQSGVEFSITCSQNNPDTGECIYWLLAAQTRLAALGVPAG